MLIANKIDVNYEVTNRQFAFASKYNLPFHFVSAADGTNVVRIFEDMLRMAKNYKENPPRSFESDVMDLLDDDTWF